MDLGALLDAIKIWTESVISTMGYPGLVLVMFLENVFPPIPSEVVLPLAGNLSNSGEFNLLWIIVWAMIGALSGALFFYGVGDWVSEERLRLLVEKYGRWALLSVEDFDKAVVFFEKHGEAAIFFGRMVPIVRSLISIPAGLARMKMPRFMLYTILGTTLWNFVLSYAGKLLGPQWGKVVEWVGVYQDVVLVLCVLLVVLYLFVQIRKRVLKKA